MTALGPVGAGHIGSALARTALDAGYDADRLRAHLAAATRR
jgi:predicted dinucleotide-binding enzyme